MKHWVLAIVFMLLCVQMVNAEPRKLVFGQTKSAKGYASMAILKAAYAKLGVEVQSAVLPPGRALVEAKEGHLDGDTHRTEDARSVLPELIRIDVPINQIEGMAFVCRDDVKVDGWESLNDKSVGIHIGIVFAEQALLNHPNVTRLPHLTQLFDALKEGRVDVVIAVRDDLIPHKNRMGSYKLQALEPPLIVKPLYHYLHKSHSDLVPDLTAILQDMHDSGEMERIRTQAAEDFWTIGPAN